MQEKRKFIRFNAPFSIRYIDKETSQESKGVTKDINYVGTRILLDNPLEICPSRLGSLSILFPDKTINVFTKAMWEKDSSDKRELGCSFINIPDASKQVIYDSIFKYARREFTQRWW